MDEFLQSSPPASGDEQPVSHGGMACRHRQDRGGKDCGYAASLGQRKRVAHIPTADAKAAGSTSHCVILPASYWLLRREQWTRTRTTSPCGRITKAEASTTRTG